MGILWSCLSVLLICCWSVIHPNVPGYKDSNRRILVRKIRYVALCLVAPEWIVLVAAGQWLSHRVVSRRVKGVSKAEEAKEKGDVEVSQISRHSRIMESCSFPLS